MYKIQAKDGSIARRDGFAAKAAAKPFNATAMGNTTGVIDKSEREPAKWQASNIIPLQAKTRHRGVISYKAKGGT